MKTTQGGRRWLVFALAVLAGTQTLRGEVVLQFFNNTWEEITARIPEIAEVGYTALWLPPPQKAGSVWSVGYDLWDPFDLGDKDQCGTVKTRYGTKAELLRLIETAHRFGMRVYFDNIMNHRAFSIPGYDENTSINIYPGMYPEDFHLQVTDEGFYRAWGDTANWNSTWEVQNRFLSGLIDIAHETPNCNFGRNEGDTYPKISAVRHPNNPAYYDYHPTLGWVGFNNTNITTNVIAQNQSYYSEDVWVYLLRSIRWLVNETYVDGLRLDAVKHVPGYFFGKQDGDKDGSDDGYCGQAQWQFNMTRGFGDWDNHRDTVFDTEKTYGRNDLMIFGEHMGEPPPYGDYWSAGMRLLDARTHGSLNGRLGNPSATLDGLQSPEYAEGVQMGQYLGVLYAKSHDDNVAYCEELHYALNLTRAGLPDIYTDGNRQAETLGESGGAFPRHANTAYLGQWGDRRIPTLVGLHNNFARHWQYPRWGDGDVVAYDRVDKRENLDFMSDADGVVLSVMVNDNYANGAYREIPTAFPNGAKLWQYSAGGGNFYTTVEDNKIKVIIPPAGYFAFSWRTPEESDLWKWGGGKPITIYQNNEPSGWMSYWRYDGPDGDRYFNPYAVGETTNYGYKWYVPRVTVATNIKFVARVDGSANNVLLRLDGGIGINGISHSSGDPRDYPPGNDGSTDVYLGYEQADFNSRVGPEKYAASDANYSKVASAGATSYEVTIGTAGYTINESGDANDWDNTYGAMFVYHNPNNQTDHGLSQFWPPPTNAAGQPIYLAVKTGHQFDINKVFVYYTTNGTSWPEGADGQPIGDTKVVELYWQTNITEEGEVNDWWGENPIPALSSGTKLRYKIGAVRRQDGGEHSGWDIPFPSTDGDIARKTKMMGTWQLGNINAETLAYRPHNDWGLTSTGLVDGFHLISARAFLQRDGSGMGNGKRAAIYNTFVQPFYLDTETPRGEIKYPTEDETIYGNEYGCVVRSDATTTKVYFHIEDNDPSNDDGQTGRTLGNGTNAAGWAWAEASEVVPSLTIDSDYMREWRFNYSNVASNDPNAIIYVKLAELSSSTNPLLTASAGWFNELVRNINADGPDYRMFVAWPQNNGDTVGAGYDMKVYFSQGLWNSDETTIRNRFLITIDGAAQGRDNYVLTWDAGGGYSELKYTLPDLYDGDPNNLHEIVVTHTNAAGGGITMTASRTVKAYPSSSGPTVQITDPPAYDSDGVRYKIILPDVASPTAEDRSYMITVQTDMSAYNTWITFTNSTGYVTAVVATNTPLTNGTVSVTQGTNIVVGVALDSELSSGVQLLISTNIVEVASVLNSTNLLLRFPYPGPTQSGLTAYRITGNPTIEGSSKIWNFRWTNIARGTYTIIANVDTNNTTNSIEATAERITSVVFREIVAADTNDLDDDDDGMYDDWETTSASLPTSNSETWTNGEVHVWYSYGKSNPLMPDSDGDGLPDALELGFRVPSDNTDTNTDTNGDGFKNYIPDIDPPIYNTVPDNSSLPGYNFNDSRTKQILGSVTDPNKADSDGDGIPDGIEDKNRNGWVDGDGESLPVGWNPWPERNWPTGVWSPSWTETDPNKADSDGDIASDGYGEDKNFNGWIDGDTNSNRVWNAGELWTETNPLNPDTDGDGLPDGWETQYGLDPLDCGILGYTNMGTGLVITNTEHGASGNPDGDEITVGESKVPYSNLMEFQNNTNPRVGDTEEPPPEGSLTLGRGAELGVLTGLSTQYVEFTEWTSDDLLALDEYEGIGHNNEGGDLYRSWDDWDTSRDLVAFYVRDGGATASGGDGKFYFRVDLHDLKAFAEEGQMNVYVVIDTGQPAVGEMVLPDEVDCITSCKWEAVVAVYDSGLGQIYIDTDRDHNTTAVGQNLADYGVVGRTLSTPNGYLGAYFNSELDSVEFAVWRQALLDAGWNGFDAEDLNFQVYTTSDDTCNSCNGGDPGPGDIGGRPDIRDAIYNDYIAEDYWDAQAGLPKVLKYWIPGSSQPNLAKFAFLLHANQAVTPGSDVQYLINNGAGGGYNRAIGSHEMFNVPLNLHITPTLAAAMQWAKVDDSAAEWRRAKYANGPLFNEWIAQLYATNLVYLLSSTFSDHILPYFTPAFNAENLALADQFLQSIYGFTRKTNTVFWAPERVLDSDTLANLANMGVQFTLMDQMTHVWEWFGRADALGTPGYRINKIEGVDCFVINDGISAVRFENHDSGVPMNLRNLLIRKALDENIKDQIVIFFADWSDFATTANADAYDYNLRWIANHQWIKPVGLEEIAADRQFGGHTWWSVERGGSLELSKQSHNWINHATRGDYDNWYLGQGSYEEGLQNKIFNIRTGVAMPTAYGMMYTAGVITTAWQRVASIANTNVATLARAALHASVFETAFHNENEHDLSRWSTGDYIYPASESNTLASFARIAQSQSRMAALYKNVDTWAAAAGTMATTMVVQADVDLDGENEYLLGNNHLLGVFERIGGRMVASFVRNTANSNVYQVTGNPASYACSETEEEGISNATTNGVVVAHRTSCFKDLWNGSQGYVNDLYTFTGVANGWQIKSSDNVITKTITLAPNTNLFNAAYSLSSGYLYIRHGLSPNLYNLLQRGQSTLGVEEFSGGVMSLANSSGGLTVSARIGYQDSGHNASVNTSATDQPDSGATFYSVQRRNQAQTHQVEMVGTNTINFSLGFEISGASSAWEQWCEENSFDPGNYTADYDTDGASNWNEFVAGTDPKNPDDFFQVGGAARVVNGINIAFDTQSGRTYYIWQTPQLIPTVWSNVTPSGISGSGTSTNWVDTASNAATSRYYKIQVVNP